MILLVHMLFGAAIGSAIKNPILAVMLALLGHYFLDIFPHVEYLESAEIAIERLKHNDSQKSNLEVGKVFLDFLIGMVCIFIFSKNYFLIYLCALVAIVPDGITVITILVPNRLLQKHHQFHQAIQHLTKKKKFSLFWRIGTQVLAVTISIILLKY